jgi:predicted MFS family arabinose efflux permease
MSFTTGAWMLVLSIFLLRQFGQGLASLTAVTSIVRYMEQGRGKALAISSMGFSVGQAFLPFLAVVAIGLIGWRSTYQLVALAVLALLPLTLWLLKGHHLRHQAYVSRMDSAEKEQSANPALRPSLNRRQMLREGRFYLLLPALMAPSYVVTALFFHHLTLAEAKGWSEAWVTGTYWIFATSAVFASLASGPLIDRFTAARVVKFFLAPMILALLLLVPVQNAGWVIIYMILLGTNSGIQVTTYSAIWPELYGTRYIGGIKSLAGALSVLSSALGPVSVGVLLDNGYSIEQVCLFFALYCVVATILLLAGLKQFRGSLG